MPSVEQARANGIFMIALNTPLEPIDAAEATFATDNFQAGVLIGQWAAAAMGDGAADAKIGMLDLAISQPTVGVLRDQGFLTGFGIDVKDVGRWGDEDDLRIKCNEVTAGNEEGGRTAMENCLAIDPEINIVYTIHEPSETRAYEALTAVDRQDDGLIVSVDGGCPGRAQRGRRCDRRHQPAVVAADGGTGHGSHRQVCRGRQPAEKHPLQGLLRHRRGTGHRPAAGGGRVDLCRGRHRPLLGAV